MKQLTDEVFAQVREALLPFAMDASGIHPDWSKERSRVSLTQAKPLTVGDFRKANAALAALDTAQPVQVNAMLVEALEEARNGLAWYQAMYPGATDGSDDEAMERIDAAIAGASNA